MSRGFFPPGTDFGLDPDAVIDPRDESDMLPRYLEWQQGGFASIHDADAMRLSQWICSKSCPLRDDRRQEFLDAYAWEMINRVRMESINQFFLVREEVWGIRLALYKNPQTKVVHLGESEFAKKVGSKPTKLLRPQDGESVWTKLLLPQAAYRGCLYGCLDNVRKKGGAGYLYGTGEQLQLQLK